MTTSPALTREIGQAERTLRALLERHLDQAGLSFPEWTVLVFLDTAGPLSAGELIQRQLDGHVASERAARAAIDRLRSAGLLRQAEEVHGAEVRDGDDPARRLVPTPAAEAVYRAVRQTVSGLTDQIFADLPLGDVEVTRRTLMAVIRRAGAQLAPVG
jgi:DNA-binding MarR family transcriptional regulator